MAQDLSRYRMQIFFDTARRRMLEAQTLLDMSRRFCDGSVTCALLAAECALKAALLFSLRADRITDLHQDTVKRAFMGVDGHKIAVLWDLVDPTVKRLSTETQSAAVHHLHHLDRYAHRYGLRRPQKLHATDAIQHSRALVDWMGEVIS